MTEEQMQDRIRDHRAEIERDIKYHEDKVADFLGELTELQDKCPHPDMGKGENYWGSPVEPNECPDCGFIKGMEG